MKNILKDFLFFNQKDRNAIILLLVLIGIAGLYSIYINSLSKIDPSHFLLQEQIQKEFEMYEDYLDDKEVVYINEETSTETSRLPKESQKQNKSANTKLSQGQVVNLNKANIETLLRIPGIGKTLAQRIIDYRTEVGSFDNVDQLLAIKGITNKKLIQILPFVILQ